MKKRLLSRLPLLGLLLLLFVAADPSATHLLYLDGAGQPLQDLDVSGSHLTGTLSADRLPTALRPATITASGTQLSLRAAAPHDRFLQIADPTAGTEFLTLDALADGAPALNLRGAPSLRVRTAATNLFTVWASGGVSVGAAPTDPGAGCLTISQNFHAVGRLSAEADLSVSGSATFDSGDIYTDGVGGFYANNAGIGYGSFDEVQVNDSLHLDARAGAPSTPAAGVTLYVDAAGNLHALHATGTDHVLSIH